MLVTPEGGRHLHLGAVPNLEAEQVELDALGEAERPNHTKTALFLGDAVAIDDDVSVGFVVKPPRLGRSYPEREVFVMGGRSTSIWVGGNDEQGFIPLARGPIPDNIPLAPHFFRPAKNRSEVYIGGHFLKFTEAVVPGGHGLIIDIESPDRVAPHVLPAGDVLRSALPAPVAVGH